MSRFPWRRLRDPGLGRSSRRLAAALLATLLAACSTQMAAAAGAGNIVFAGERLGKPVIYVRGPGSSRPRVLPTSGWAYGPAVSPGGRRVAFRRNGTRGAEIWTVYEDGTAPIQLTAGPHDREPRWSPAGDPSYLPVAAPEGATSTSSAPTEPAPGGSASAAVTTTRPPGRRAAVSPSCAGPAVIAAAAATSTSSTPRVVEGVRSLAGTLTIAHLPGARTDEDSSSRAGDPDSTTSTCSSRVIRTPAG